MFFIAYTLKAQVHKFAGRVKIVSCLYNTPYSFIRLINSYVNLACFIEAILVTVNAVTLDQLTL